LGTLSGVGKKEKIFSILSKNLFKMLFSKMATDLFFKNKT